MNKFFDNIWTIRFTDKQGNLLYENIGNNALANDGEDWVLRAAFRNEYATDKLYVRLCNQILAETTLLSDITTEPTGNGYYSGDVSLYELTRDEAGFPTFEEVGGDVRLKSRTIAFTASGGSIGPISTVFLATKPAGDSTGKLICYRALPITQSILNGNSGTAFFRLKLS